MNTCIYCQREFSNKGGLGAHRPFCKSNPNRVQRAKSPNAHAKKGTIPWNIGLTVANTPALIRTPETKAKLAAISSTRTHSLETKQRLSEVAKDRNFGGYVQGSGQGKKGWYKGFFCDSSWELAYVVYCLEHSIDIKRNTEKRQYIWQGVVKNYIPDFIVQGNLTEVKGFKTEQWLAKLEANKDINVLYEKDLQPILEYVKTKYGNNFLHLYE
jgi:hypothetical protein